MKCVCVWLWYERSKSNSKSIIIIIRNRKRVQRTEWQNKVIINMNRADTAQQTTRTNFKTNLNLWCSFVIHVWKHPNHSNNALLVEPLEKVERFDLLAKKTKKHSEFLLFNFIYFFPIISVLFFFSLCIHLQSIVDDINLCVYSPYSSFLDSEHQTRLLLIRAHLINFSIFYNLLSIFDSFALDTWVCFGFWFSGFFYRQFYSFRLNVFFFRLENCRLTNFQSVVFAFRKLPA